MAVFNRDRQTGKKIGRSLIDSGDAMPTQFNSPVMPSNTSTGSTVNLGGVVGGGMGRANNMAGKTVGKMPPIPLGAIYGE